LIETLFTQQTKSRIVPVAPVVTSCRASRVSRDGPGHVALTATCCAERTAQHLRHSTYDFFLYQYAWAGSRVVTCRDAWRAATSGFRAYPRLYI